jgi:hypothetical protein
VKTPVIFFILLLVVISRARSATLYVSLNSTNPVPPYTDWSTAATNIQDAIDASTNGDLILVTNGVYQTGGRLSNDGATNRVVVPDAVTLQSVNGQLATLIDGGNTVRCVYLTNGAVLSGFSVTNGNAGTFNGGGIYCAPVINIYGEVFNSTALIENCLIVSNRSSYGGGIMYGSVSNCILSCNISSSISPNPYVRGGGGAAWAVLDSCILSNNSAAYGGGGAYGSTLNNCVIWGNSALADGGGVAGSTLNNCLVVSNSCSGSGGGAEGGSLHNCTIVRNSADQYGGGAGLGPAANCIIYYNSGTFVWSDNYDLIMTNCCTTFIDMVNASHGNITNEPLFVNLVAGDFHLQSNSPCINSGNNGFVMGVTDLDVNPRIVGGTVDIGAYEYQTPVSHISYAWLQQYGLPITTNTDTADPDGDGMNNYQEWMAGTNPTNALSVLAMLTPVPTNNPAGLVVSWESVNNRRYFLESSTNLAAQPAFSTTQSNIIGQTGTTSFTDTTATNAGLHFYRVGVQ